VVVHNISVTLNAIQIDVEGCISETEVAKFMEALFAVDELRELVRLRNAFVAERAVQILERSERNSGYIHVKVRRLQNLLECLVIQVLLTSKTSRLSVALEKSRLLDLYCSPLSDTGCANLVATFE
jgi:hypothetical protein